MFFRAETNVQNTQKGVLATLLEEIHRACFPLVLCIRAVAFCIKYFTETNKSWAALWSDSIQKQVGLATRSGMPQHNVCGGACIFCTKIPRRWVGSQPHWQIAPILQTEVMSEINTCTRCHTPCTEQRRSWPETKIFGWKFLILSCRDGFKALGQIILLPLERR